MTTLKQFSPLRLSAGDLTAASTRRAVCRFWLVAFIAASLVLPGVGSELKAQRLRLRIGVENHTPPLSFLDEENQHDGFTAELLREVSRAGSIDFEIVAAHWTGLLREFNAGRLDVLANVTIQESRRASMDFSIGHAYTHGVVYFRSDRSKMEKTADFAGKKITVLGGSVAYTNAMAHQGWGATIIPIDSWQGALDATARGECDAALFLGTISANVINDHGLERRFVNDIIHQYHFAVHKGDSATLARLNEALAIVRADGSFDRAYAKWIGPIEPHPIRIADLRPYFLPGAGILLAIILIFVWQRRMLAQRALQAAALREAEERYRGLVDSVFDGSMIHQDGIIKTVNTASAAMFGYTVDELIGRSVMELTPSDVRDQITSAIQADHVTPYVTSGLRKDGTRITIETASKACTYQGKRAKIVAVRDITERVRTEQQLREQAALLDVTRDAIVVVDLDGRVTYWNHGAEKLYEWPAKEALGQSFATLVCGKYALEASIAIQAVQDRGQWSGELHQLTRSGVSLVALCRGVLMLNPAGGAQSIFFTASDVTQAKRTEAQLLRAQRLESLGSLASGVAHDLNNVLTPIMMSIEMLTPLAREPHDRDMVKLLSDSVRRGAGIVRQLLQFGRGSDLPRHEVDATLVLRELQRMLQETFPKNIVLSMQVPTDLWPLQSDETQLQQVLLNLCVNARDAMPQGGRLSVSAENVQIDEELASNQIKARPGPHLFLRVTDTGTGIQPEVIEQIFDPFFTTKPVGQGTGLGLAAVLGIVQSHGGFITVKSQPGVGSEFGVYLPAEASVGKTPLDHTFRADIRGRGELILVVDDEVSIREIQQRALKNNGYEVVTASDGQEALVQLAAHGAKIRLVVTDVMMPGMDGLQLVPAMRQLFPQLPVIAISGLQAHRAEFDKFPPPRVLHLAKPFRIDELLTTIHGQLQVSPVA